MDDPQADQPAPGYTTPSSYPYHPYAAVLPQSPPRRAAANRWLVLGLVAGLLVSGGALVGALRLAAHDRRPAGAAPLALPSRSATDSSLVTADHTADGVVVDEAMASRILAAYWPAHEQALVSRDLPALRGMSAGSARRWEQAVVACGCLHVDAPRPLLREAYFVPRQRSFPATFDAEALTEAGGTYWAELLVFTKSAAGQPWLVSEDSGFGPPPGQPPALGRPDLVGAGYDRPVTAEQSRVAHHVAARLAALWQRAKDRGAVPARSEFDLTGQTGERIGVIAAHRQDGIQANGVLGHYRFSTRRSDPLVQVSDAGSDLACQPIHERVAYTAPAGQVIYQDEGRRQWGPSLAPGEYQRVVSSDVWETCFLIPPDRDAPIGVLDHDDGGSLTTAAPTATT